MQLKNCNVLEINSGSSDEPASDDYDTQNDTTISNNSMKDNSCNNLLTMASLLGVTYGTSQVLIIAMIYLDGNKTLLCLYCCLPRYY